jgi:hypothetical protein
VDSQNEPELQEGDLVVAQMSVREKTPLCNSHSASHASSPKCGLLSLSLPVALLRTNPT